MQVVIIIRYHYLRRKCPFVLSNLDLTEKKLFSVKTEIEFFKDERKTREIENEVIKIAIPIEKRKPYHIIMS